MAHLGADPSQNLEQVLRRTWKKKQESLHDTGRMNLIVHYWVKQVNSFLIHANQHIHIIGIPCIYKSGDTGETRVLACFSRKELCNYLPMYYLVWKFFTAILQKRGMDTSYVRVGPSFLQVTTLRVVMATVYIYTSPAFGLFA